MYSRGTQELVKYMIYNIVYALLHIILINLSIKARNRYKEKINLPFLVLCLFMTCYVFGWMPYSLFAISIWYVAVFLLIGFAVVIGLSLVL